MDKTHWHRQAYSLNNIDDVVAALGCFRIRGAQIVAVHVKWARGAPTTIDELFDRGQLLEMSTQSRMIARWCSSRISSITMVHLECVRPVY